MTAGTGLSMALICALPLAFLNSVMIACDPRIAFAGKRLRNLGPNGLPQFIKVFCGDMREGGPITVTHRDITRYFMTIPEAARLVITAGALAQGGEILSGRKAKNSLTKHIDNSIIVTPTRNASPKAQFMSYECLEIPGEELSAFSIIEKEIEWLESTGKIVWPPQRPGGAAYERA